MSLAHRRGLLLQTESLGKVFNSGVFLGLSNLKACNFVSNVIKVGRHLVSEGDGHFRDWLSFEALANHILVHKVIYSALTQSLVEVVDGTSLLHAGLVDSILVASIIELRDGIFKPEAPTYFLLVA